MQEQKLLRNKHKALNEGNRDLLASTCIDLANLYFKNENYEYAIQEYIVVAEVYNEMGKLIDYAQANRMIGEAYMHLRRFEEALHYQRIHLNIAKEQNDKLEEQRALATIGLTYLTIYLDIENNPDKSSLQLAYKYFMKSLQVCENLTGISKGEHKDMIARLLANIGVVQENLGDYDKGIELLQKSINICKSNDLFEQLERSHTCLGALYVHRKEYDKAINQYNLAIDVAKRSKDKISLMSAILFAKAEVLVKLADYRGAKSVLLKAYKLKSPNSTELNNIERNLKIVTAMYYAENSLLTVSDFDYKTKKQLYEKLGDGASELKAFSSALEYYSKMLEAAKQNDESGFDLSPCYISIAETYADLKQFDKAIEFYRKDHSVCTRYTKESIVSLLNIADCMEALDKDVLEIESVYEQARNESANSNETQLKRKVFSRYIKLLRKNGKLSDIVRLEKELNKLDTENADSESEPLEEQQISHVGHDISIGEITDETDDSDVEDATSKPRTSRRRTKGLQVKRNPKGETQLHQACISGNAELVRHLLDRGHPVNVRDNCGWLPIHEASNYGYTEVVEMLLNKGALVNDGGGKLCNGMTPLHDAATNGNLDVIQLLLNRGASTIVKNHYGEMPLHILKKWRNSIANLDPIKQSVYDNLVERLTKDMEKLGHNKNIIITEGKNTALVIDGDESFSNVRRTRRSTDSEENKKNRIGNLRRNMSFDDDDDLNMMPKMKHNVNDKDFKEETGAGNEYRRAIEGVRHPLREENIERKRKSNENRHRSAYLQTEEVGDDWLEDDIGLNQNKKRKTNSADTLINTLGSRKSSSGSLRHPSNTSLKSANSANDGFEVDDESCESDVDIKEIETEQNIIDMIDSDDSDMQTNKNNRGSFSSQTKKRKSQCSLIDKGFTRHHSFSPTNLVTASGSTTQKKKKSQTKLSNFLHSHSDVDLESLISISNRDGDNHNSSKLVNAEVTWSVDVRINGKLYRVPVLASETHTRTIKWLADEAAKRYSRKECVKPTLELETKNGAVLADDDFLNILFASGTNHAEEVEARIIKWNMPPLADRYNEACSSLNIEPNRNVTKILQEVSTSLNISDMGLKNKNVAPVCKIINRQINLHHINFSGNTILNESFQLLCSSLTSLDNLSILDLSLTHLTSNNLESLADTFTQSSKTILKNLVSLDLCYNPLGDESMKYLAIITRYLRLQILKLVSVDFTSEIFNVISNRNIDLHLDYLIDFNVSYNKLGRQQLKVFLTWLKPENVEHLNVSNNVINEELFVKDVVDWLDGKGNDKLKLKSLDLSRCCAQDVETIALLRVLQSAKHFSSLNLSYNENLTAKSLQGLVQHQPSLDNLDLTGCKNIFKYFDEHIASVWDSINFKTVKLSYDSKDDKESKILMGAWKNKYQQKSKVIEVIPGFVDLCVCD